MNMYEAVFTLCFRTVPILLRIARIQYAIIFDRSQVTGRKRLRHTTCDMQYAPCRSFQRE